MKCRWTVFVVLLLLSSMPSKAQQRENLYLELWEFRSDLMSLHAERVRNVLFSDHEFFMDDNLLQAICLPSFTPPWAIRLYHPSITWFDSAVGLPAWGTDTTKWIIESRRAAFFVLADPKQNKAIAKRTKTGTRHLPESQAKEAIAAFVATLPLARWPTHNDLVHLDGTIYHYFVEEGHGLKSTYLSAQAHDPDPGTRTEKLTLIAKALADFAENSSDSTARASLETIHALSQALLQQQGGTP